MKHTIQPIWVRMKDIPSVIGTSLSWFRLHMADKIKPIYLGDNPQCGIVYDYTELVSVCDRIKESGRPKKGETWPSELAKEKAPPTTKSQVLSKESELGKVLQVKFGQKPKE